MADFSESLESIFQSAVIMIIGALLGRVFGLLGEAMVARYLQPDLYGQVALAYTIVSTLGSVALLGVHEGVTRLGTAESSPEERMNLFAAAFLTAAVGGVVVMCTLFLTLEIVAGFLLKDGLNKYLMLMLPFLILFPLSQVVVSILRVQQRSTATVLTRAIAARVIPIGLLAVAILLDLGSASGVIYWTSIPLVIIFIGGWLAIRQIEVIKLQLPDQETLTNLWSFSWPLAASSIVFLLLSQLDVLMIGYFLDSEKVGYYRAIQPLRQAATIFMGSFSFLFLPLATQYYQRGELGEMAGLFSSVTKWAVILTLPIVSVFIFLSQEVVITFYGKSYLESALPLAVLSGGLFLRTLSGPNGDVVKAINRPRIEAYASTVGVVINFSLNCVLIPRYGIIGAAIATVFGYAIYNAIELGMIYSKTNISPFSMSIMKPVVSCLAVLWILHSRFSPLSDSIAIISFGLFSGIVAVVSVIGTRSVEEPDLFLLNRIETRIGKTFPLMRRTLEWGIRGKS